MKSKSQNPERASQMVREVRSDLAAKFGSSLKVTTAADGGSLTIAPGKAGHHATFTLESGVRIVFKPQPSDREITFAPQPDGYLISVTYDHGASRDDWPYPDDCYHREELVKGILYVFGEFVTKVGTPWEEEGDHD
jgi:hypothetical protein